MLPEESRLLEQLAQKDNEAYKQLYRIYYPVLKNLAIQLSKDEEVAADLVQEVFISLWESSTRFNNTNELKYFLYHSLKNKYITYYRKQQVRNKYQQEMRETLDEREYFWEKVLEEDVYANLLAAIDTLSPRHREVLRLTLDGLKIAEIAERLQISPETVKEYKKNGKRRLLQILENPFLLLLISCL